MKKQEVIKIVSELTSNAKVDFGIPNITYPNTFFIVRKNKSDSFFVNFIDLQERGIRPNFMSKFNNKDEICCTVLSGNIED